MTAGESPGVWNLIALSRTPYGGGSGASAPERTGSTTRTGLQPEPARTRPFASAGGDTYHGDRWVLGVILVSELSSLCGRMGGSVQTEPKAVWPSTQRMWTWASGSVHYKLLFSPVLYCTSPTGTGGRHGLNRRSVPRGAAASGPGCRLDAPAGLTWLAPRSATQRLWRSGPAALSGTQISPLQNADGNKPALQAAGKIRSVVGVDYCYH